MVGAFGEVQVMDWGLAKVLPTAGAGQPEKEPPAAAAQQVSLIRSPRNRTADIVQETSAGSVLGTASYMSQEQALGEVDRLDERCDVFSLGGTLCQILTGQPPYVAESSEAISRKAARADLAEAFARLDACGADAELISLTKRCLAAQAENRPPTAHVLAREVTGYLESVEVRLRQAELDRAQAEVRAREERRRLKLWLALALAVLLFLGVGSGGLLWFRGRQSETERIVTLAIGKAEQLRDQAAKMPILEIESKPGVDLLDQAEAAVRRAEAIVTAWKHAQSAAQEAEAALSAGVAPSSLYRRAASLRSELDQYRASAEEEQLQIARDHRLLRDLDLARLTRNVLSDGKIDTADSAEQYAAAFARYGLELKEQNSDALAVKISAQKPAIREALIVALDNWHFLENSLKDSHLKAIANAVDANEWRRRLRGVTTIGELVALSLEATQHSPDRANIEHLALLLKANNHDEEAIELLRWVRDLDPPDFWICLRLGGWLGGIKSPSDVEIEELVGCYRVCLALRPRATVVHRYLGESLVKQGKVELALREFRLATDVDSKRELSAHYYCGWAFFEMKSWDEAIAEFRRAMEIDPASVSARNALCLTLINKEQFDEAIAEARRTLEINPSTAFTYYCTGAALARKKLWDEAIAEFQLAIGIDSKYFYSYVGMGDAFIGKGQFDDAIEQYRLAIQVDPKHRHVAGAHHGLASALARQKRWGEAIAEYRRALQINPQLVHSHLGLGDAFLNTGRFDEAVVEYRKATQIDPKDAHTHHGLASALARKMLWDQAIVEYRLALGIDWQLVDSHIGLGNALIDKGQFDEAIAEFRLAIQIDPEHHHSAHAHHGVASALSRKKLWDEAIVEYRLALEIDPQFVGSHRGLASALAAKKLWDEAIAEYGLALEIDPQLVDSRRGLGEAFISTGRFDEAITEFRRAVQIDPKNAHSHHGLASALARLKLWDGAIAEYRLALEIDPQLVNSRSGLGGAFISRGQFDEAIAEFRRAVQIDQKNAPCHHGLASALARKKLWDEAIAEYRQALEIDPQVVNSRTGLADALIATGRFDEAVAEFRQAVQIEPKNAHSHHALASALARQNLWDEAIAEYGLALEIDPQLVNSHIGLGQALIGKGQFDEAIVEFRSAVQLEPKRVHSHHGLGVALAGTRRWDEAVVEFRLAIEIDPKYADPHIHLAAALRARGEFTQARESVQCASELSEPGSRLRQDCADRIQDIDRLIALEKRLEGVLSGADAPTNVTERWSFVEVCRLKRRFESAVKLYSQAFGSDASLAGNLNARHRYNAACCAALAGCQREFDSGTPQEGLRRQAIYWLRADLEACSKVLESGKPEDRQRVQMTLRHWQTDSDLAGLREAKELEKLAAEEREACQKLWADVAQLLERAAATP